jgi:hypothetical protein
MSGEAPAAAGVGAAVAAPSGRGARSLAWAPPHLAALPRDAPQQFADAAERAGEKLAAVASAAEERSLNIATRAWNAVSGNGPQALHDVNERQEATLLSADDLHLPGIEARPSRGGGLMAARACIVANNCACALAAS